MTQVYCKFHACTVDGCGNQKATLDRYCAFHKCDAPYCRGQMVDCTQTCAQHACTVAGCGLPAHRRKVRIGTEYWEEEVFVREARCEMHSCKFPGCDKQPTDRRFCSLHAPQDASTVMENFDDTEDSSFIKHSSAQTDPIRVRVANLAPPQLPTPRIGGGYFLPTAAPARVLDAEYGPCWGADGRH